MSHPAKYQNSALLRIMLFLLFLLTLFSFLSLGFTNQDDMLLHLNFRMRNLETRPLAYLLNLAFSEAQYYGRVWVAYGTLASFVAYISESSAYLHTIWIGSIVANILLFAAVVRRYSGTPTLGSLLVAIFLLLLQNSTHWNLFTAFPGYFVGGLSFLFGALLLFDKAEQDNSRWPALVAAFCFFMSCMTFEVFVLYYGIFVAIAAHDYLFKNPQRPQALRHNLRRLLPVSIGLACYLLAYFIFARIYPGRYGGAQASMPEMTSYFTTLARLVEGALPARLFDSNSYNPFYIALSDEAVGHKSSLAYVVRHHLRVEWIVRAVLGTTIIWTILRKPDWSPMRWPIFGWTCAFCLTLFILPATLPALTKRYQILVGMGLPSYLVTWFSYYAVVLGLVVLLAQFSAVWKERRRLQTALLLMTVILMAAWSIKTDYHNHYIAKSQAMEHAKWRLMQALIKRKVFRGLPTGSVVYAPSLWQHSELPPMLEDQRYWSRYVETATGHRITFLKTYAQLDKRVRKGLRHWYYLKISQDTRDTHIFAVLAPVRSWRLKQGEPELTADQATLLTFGPHKEFSVYFRTNRGGSRSSVDGKPLGDADYARAVVRKSRDAAREPLVVTRLTGVELDPASVTISPFIDVSDFRYNRMPPTDYIIDREKALQEARQRMRAKNK